MFPAEGTANANSRGPEVKALLTCLRINQRLCVAGAQKGAGGMSSGERLGWAVWGAMVRTWAFILSTVGALGKHRSHCGEQPRDMD